MMIFMVPGVTQMILSFPGITALFLDVSTWYASGIVNWAVSVKPWCHCIPFCCHLWQQKMYNYIKNQLHTTKKEWREATCAMYKQEVFILDQFGVFRAYLCSRSLKGLLQIVKHIPADLAIE